MSRFRMALTLAALALLSGCALADDNPFAGPFTVPAAAPAVGGITGTAVLLSSNTAAYELYDTSPGVDMRTYTMPANTLDADGKAIAVAASGNGSGDNGVITLRVGGQQLAQASTAGNVWAISCVVTRTGSNAQAYACYSGANGATTETTGTLTLNDGAEIAVAEHGYVEAGFTAAYGLSFMVFGINTGS